MRHQACLPAGGLRPHPFGDAMTTTEDALVRAIFDDPGDTIARAAYADWLQERGDLRGEFLRLLLDLEGLPNGDRRVAETGARVTALRQVIDRRWAALFDEYGGMVRETRTVRLRLKTYRKAPKQYGGAYKVGLVERA